MTDISLSRLEAETAIRRLVSAYCDAVGRLDADAAIRLFAPDCRVRIADLPERNGLQSMLEGLSQTFSVFSFLHQQCDAGLIDVDPARGHARARLTVFEANRRRDADEISLIFGNYEDEYVLLAEGWRFHTRKFTLRLRALVPAAKIQETPGFVPTGQFDV